MGENLDRDNIDLPGGQQRLLEAVAATGKPVVLILLNGGPLSITWATEKIPAIIEGWYLGQATGTALAQVIAGDINPGGKLPVTMPRHVGRSPSYYYQPPAARIMNYYNSPDAPLFPFGHGLSYTTFAYSDLTLTPTSIVAGQAATARVTIKNTGARAGDEVVQLYLRDDVSSRVRPAKELKGFQRITLAPGESRVVEFPIGFDQLKFWKDGAWTVEPGTFTVMVGSSSEDLRLKETLRVKAFP
jgi:beta-glucosidase